MQRSYDALAEAKGELDSRLAMEMVTREHLQVTAAAAAAAAVLNSSQSLQDALRRKQHELGNA